MNPSCMFHVVMHHITANATPSRSKNIWLASWSLCDIRCTLSCFDIPPDPACSSWPSMFLLTQHSSWPSMLLLTRHSSWPSMFLLAQHAPPDPACWWCFQTCHYFASHKCIFLLFSETNVFDITSHFISNLMTAAALMSVAQWCSAAKNEFCLVDILINNVYVQGFVGKNTIATEGQALPLNMIVPPVTAVKLGRPPHSPVWMGPTPMWATLSSVWPALLVGSAMTSKSTPALVHLGISVQRELDWIGSIVLQVRVLQRS